LSQSFWLNLRTRISCPISVEIINDRSLGGWLISSQSSSFDGIIAHLIMKRRNNVDDHGIVKVISSSGNNSSYPLKNTVDLIQTTYFKPANQTNVFVMISRKCKLNQAKSLLSAFTQHLE